MRRRLPLVLALVGVVLLVVMVVMPHLHDRMVATAPMGSTLTVTVPGDGSSTLYASHRFWWDYDCTVTTADGRAAMLRPDMFARTLPGGWWPRGALIDAGRLTVSCSSPHGGRFAVGPTRGAGYLALRGALLAVGVGLLVAAVVVAVGRRLRRRRAAD